MLMQERASDIIAGIEILVKLLSPKAVLIGIEDDKPIAAASLKAAIGQRTNYFVREVPTKYPSGGEKQLIQLLTNKEVPAGRRPLDIGIVMQNVGTAFAIAQAVLDDIPLIRPRRNSRRRNFSATTKRVGADRHSYLRLY